MNIIYQALFKYEKEKEELLLTRVLPNGSQDTSPVTPEDIKWAEETCRGFLWNHSPGLAEQIGKRFFDLLNGDSKTLQHALNEADNHGEPLQICIRPDGPASHWPFELLYHTECFVPSRAHLVHLVSDLGCKSTPQPKDRPLRVLFMACSPEGISPGLRIEKEEETIFEITKDDPVEVDVEDTGTLYGLGESLVRNEYDIVHLSGHADIDEDGIPFFFMEDEEGFPVKVTPERLWDKLKLNPPRLLFLSGCNTGQLAVNEGAVSFANYLVSHHSATVLGWGLTMSDTDASFAARKLYFELSRGKDILHAVHELRCELFAHSRSDQSLLRLFSDGTPMNIPLVYSGQKKQPKMRDLRYTYLRNSQVKVITKGFVGRRRMIQKGLRCLKKDNEKIGLLLYGKYGLGKSCLAGMFCNWFKDHTPIIVQGPLTEVTFAEALKDAFVLAEDRKGQQQLKEEIEWPDKIRMLCSTSFQEKSYLIMLDGFEKNLVDIEEGRLGVSSETAPIFKALLRYLPYSNKMSRLIITSRYPFSIKLNGLNMVDGCLESIGLTSFHGADKWKKLSELDQLSCYPDPEMIKQLIEAGRGNPRLMEALNTLVKEVRDLDIAFLLSEVKDKQEDFFHNLILRKILAGKEEGFQRLMRHCSVFRLPVSYKGIGLVCENIKDWESHTQQAVRLGLMEQGKDHKGASLYWVTPLLRTGIFEELREKERKQYHKAAVTYYQVALSETTSYSPIIALELIEHALQAGMEDPAIEAGGQLLLYLRESLAYKEALSHGESILSRISVKKRDKKFAAFLFQLGWIYHDTADANKAVEYYKQALSIDKKVFGDSYPCVAADLNNLGEAWRALGEHKKAIEYYDQALSIDKKVFGDAHPSVAKDLNNLGEAWRAFGEHMKAIEYYEQALSVCKKVFGDTHPKVAIGFNNLGAVWHALGEHMKAIEYYEQALSINKKVYGITHPDVAIRLNNLGAAWRALGDTKKAVEYFEQAYDILLEFYKDKHPQIKIVKEWLDSLKNENY